MSSPSGHNPVVLVHGIDDTATLFCKMRPYLQAQHRDVHCLDLTPNNGQVGLNVLAQQIQTYIEREFSAGQLFDLVGFSMGGIVSRYYVQRLGGSERVQRLVTISSPHQGTWVAYFRPNEGGTQMRCRSPFLDDLNRDIATLRHINITTIWTPLDLMIVPARSSQLPIGRDIVIPVLNHAWMVHDARVLRAVAEALDEPLCTQLPSGSSALNV